MLNNRIFLKLGLLLRCSLCFYIVHWGMAAKVDNTLRHNFAACNANLEKQFLTNSVKCSRSGFFPVKGSCTAYIPCISFGQDLMKPLKRVECSSGMVFDVTHLRCRPVQKLDNNCLQRKCYPTETILEDGEQSSSISSVEEPKETVNANTNMDDVVEIAVDPQDIGNGTNDCDDKLGSRAHVHKNNSHLVIISSAVADRGNLNYLRIQTCFNVLLISIHLSYQGFHT